MKKNKLKYFSNLKHFQSPDHFGKELGYRISKLYPKSNRATASLKIAKKHLSPAGRVHGGVISAFSDFTAGAAVFLTLAEDEKCATIELKINFLKQIFVGETLICDARVVFRGRRLCVVETQLKTGKDVAAISLTTFNVVPSTLKKPNRAKN